MATIYGPVCQYVFLLSYMMAPGWLWPLKAVLLMADVLLILCLLKLTTPRNALLYAWCPLAIFETSFNAHPEVLGVAAMMGAVYFVRTGRAGAAAVLGAVGVAARVHALLLVPLILLRQRLRAVFMFAGIGALLYAPFWVQESTADWAGLRVFLGEWEFNSTVYAIVAHWMGPDVSTMITGIAACIAISLAYVHGLNYQAAALGPYEHPVWVRVAELVIVGLGCLADYARRLFATERKAG